MDFISGSLIMTDQWQSAMKQANVIGRCEMTKTILGIEANQLGVQDEE